MVIVVNKNDAEFWTTIAAIPVIIFILILAGVFTRRESRLGMSGIIVGLSLPRRADIEADLCTNQTLYFVALAYFIYKLFRMYQKSREAQYLPVRKSLTAFAVITIVLIVMTITNAVMCTVNFGKGLKPHIAARKVDSEEEKVHMTEMPNLSHGPVPSRMTID